MKKPLLQIGLLAAALLVVCVLSRMLMHDTFMVDVPLPAGARAGAGDFRIVEESNGVVTHGVPQLHGDYVRVPIHPERAGETYLNIYSGSGEPLGGRYLRVGRFHTVYDMSSGGFTGDWVVLSSCTLFWLASAAIMLRAFCRTRGPAFYALSTVHAAGFVFFALLAGVSMLYVTVRHISDPADYNMFSAYSAITGVSFTFIMVTAPLMFAFSAAMAVSNVELLRHERFRYRNVLGILIAVLLIAGVLTARYLYFRDFVGSEREWRLHNTLQNVYATGFAYFECMLCGAIVCGIRAARHVPAQDADYILILGCRFRADGTLPPLLRGRVDRAISFWRAQKEQTGREAVLIPSGGQGPDEVMPEAHAMRNYLLGQGIPESCIRVEDRSRNTFENMSFSKALIERERPQARTVSATTNYHVFRSGVLASKAGLSAEGMGSRTKWWFWPNAFMRECVGLMYNRIPQELALLAVLLAFFGALSMALG